MVLCLPRHIIPPPRIRLTRVLPPQYPLPLHGTPVLLSAFPAPPAHGGSCVLGLWLGHRRVLRGSAVLKVGGSIISGMRTRDEGCEESCSVC
jgi:hypothetical protein